MAYRAVSILDPYPDLWITNWGDPPGCPPPYTTIDIWSDLGLREGVANQIYARVRNDTDHPANALVHFRANVYGIQWDAIGTVPCAVPPYSNVVVSVPWTPPNIVGTLRQVRISVDIECEEDLNNANNHAIEVFSYVELITNPLEIPIILQNVSEIWTRKYFLLVNPWHLPIGWEVEFSHQFPVELNPGDSLLTSMTVTPSPGASTAGRRCRRSR